MANPAFSGPEGRLVQGDAFEPQTKDQNGNPLVVKTGPNAGQPTQRWFMAVAYDKRHPETLPYLQKLAEIARAAWPAYFTAFNPNNPPLFGCSHPRFSIKIMDGDGVDDNGKPNNTKEGFAGHWVVKYSSSFQAPGVWDIGNLDEMARITDPRALQRGFYVRMFCSVETNGNDQRPGIYVNLSKVAIMRPGPIIQTGPSAADAFGGSGPVITTDYTVHPTTPPAPALPSAPAAPVGLVATGKDGYTIEALRAGGWTDDQIVAGGYATRPLPATPPAAPPAPTPPAAPPVPITATPSPSNVQPYGGYMQTATPPAPPAPPAAPVETGGAPAGFKMLPAAQGATYQMMLANGWNDDLLKANGMMGPL